MAARKKKAGKKDVALLRLAGIETLEHLAEADPDETLHRLIVANATYRLKRTPPNTSRVNAWIDTAQSTQTGPITELLRSIGDSSSRGRDARRRAGRALRGLQQQQEGVSPGFAEQPSQPAVAEAAELPGTETTGGRFRPTK